MLNFLPQTGTVLEALLLKLHKPCTPSPMQKVHSRVGAHLSKFDFIKKIGPNVGGGCSFEGGHSFESGCTYYGI